ncbi:MAG: 1,4-alpha-glucan-branching enzyme, partial [Bacteroidales bacterium]|nr:1,4-alpha-glucan-branching enzyme [Bacteroidales bacterium]
MQKSKFKLLEQDPWLEASSDEIVDRYNRFREKAGFIDSNFGSVTRFADGYKYFGTNYDSKRKGWYYREWAPQAHALYLTGDFNNWREYSHPLTKDEYGVWEIFLEEKEYRETFVHSSKIKVIVKSEKGVQYRIPAYIRRVIQDDITKEYWGQVWLPQRFNWENDNFSLKNTDQLFIYEAHVGMAQEKEGLGTYREFTDFNLPKIKEAGYNTVQLMAIQEHPYYGSFGYHVANFFAPSSRFGTPEDLKELVKKAHSLGIAVILDIVHSHTVKNTIEGLNEFDGSDSQYFHAGARGDHPQW